MNGQGQIELFRAKLFGAQKSIFKIATVGEKFCAVAGSNFFQSFNRRSELHAIIGRMLRAAENFFAVIARVDDDRRPTTRARIP